jgi:hypothetical protein
MRTETTCRFCGARVISDDAARTVAHDEPVCAEFDRAARAGSEQPEVSTASDTQLDSVLKEQAHDLWGRR